MAEPRDVIRQYVIAHHFTGGAAALRNDMPLVSSGVLDSLAVLALVSFLERSFAIRFSASEIASETFDRIEDMALLVSRKRAA